MGLSTIAVRALEAHQSYFRAFTERGGGRVLDDGGVLSWHSRHPMGFLVNAIIRTEPHVDAHDVLTEADRRFATAHEVITVVGRDDDLLDLAVERGATAEGTDPLQVLADLSSVPSPIVPPSIDVRLVIDDAGVADIARINTEATASFGFPEDLFPTVFAEPTTVLAGGMLAVVAYEDDQPMATAQVHLNGPMAYVGWVATTPGAMRRGLGSLVTRDVIARAADRGAAEASLMASPMGAPVYRRMGFADVAWLRSVTRPGCA